MKKHPILLGVLAFLALAFAAALFLNDRYRGTTALPVTRGDIVETVYGLGTVTANQTFQIKIGVTTALEKLYVREGDTVKAGARLLKLGEGEVFRAPFDGTVTAIPYKIEETVYPQTPILTLVNLADRYILISLEQEGALRVRAGQTARMSFETIRGKLFVGKVRSLYPGENQFLVQIDVPELPPEVLPGMTGDVAIEVTRRHDALLVPIRAVQASRVLVRKGGKTKQVPITLGAIDGRSGEVTSGDLQAGDEVLLPKDL